MTAISCQANAQGFMPEPTERDEHTLTVGSMTMVIDAARGGRITHLCFNDQEVLSQIPAPNMYGSTFWTSPQKEWNWPPVREHDIMAYSVEEIENGLVMTSQLSEKFPIRIKKKFVADKENNCFSITYTMINESGEPRKVAPWEITRVPAEGSIFFEANVEEITPAGLMPFVQKNNLAWFDINHVDKQRKINSDGKGWLSYVNNGLKLTKRFPDLDPSQPAPDEAEIQIYVHQGKAYVELEAQGAYEVLKPGESVDWTVNWFLSEAK